MENTRFKELSIGKWFDFISPKHGYNSFFERCVKTSKRTYISKAGSRYQVGSINCKVYHVTDKP